MRRQLFRHIAVWRYFLLGIILVIILGLIYSFSRPFISLARDIFTGPINIFSIILPNSDTIKNTEGRTNILILGIGGSEHDGPNLTDTIMVASIKTVISKDEDPSKSPIILISIPRDTYLDSLGGKINSAYAIGMNKDPKTGLILAAGAVSSVTGLPIHYAIKIDFSAFEQIINTLGGVDITVENAFDDYEYPIDGKENDLCAGDPLFKCRYEHIHFDSGPTHMDGATALKFARSRHAEGEEGTDFARAKRQQLVIAGIKTKIFSSGTFLNPGKIEQIYSLLKDHINSDIPPSLIDDFLKIALQYRGSKFKSVVLGLDLLENPPIDERGWILLPKGGNWDQIRQYIRDQIGK